MHTCVHIWTEFSYARPGRWFHLLFFPVCAFSSLAGVAQALPCWGLTVLWKSRSQLKRFCICPLFFPFPWLGFWGVCFFWLVVCLLLLTQVMGFRTEGEEELRLEPASELWWRSCLLPSGQGLGRPGVWCCPGTEGVSPLSLLQVQHPQPKCEGALCCV